MKPTHHHVTSSRMAALWDEHRYLTKRMLWEYCAKGRDPDTGDNPRARSGRMLEAGILAMAAEDLGCDVVHLPQGHSGRLERGQISCLADGLVLHPEKGLGVVEAKAVSWQAWAKNWTPMQYGVPRSYELQLQTQLHVWQDPTGPNAEAIEAFGPPTWGCIAAMNDLDVHLFERQIEPTLHDQMVTAVGEFFYSIEKDNPPPLSYTVEELPLIKELYPYGGDEYSVRALEKVEDLGAFNENCELLITANARRKAAEADIDEAKGHILELAAGNRMVIGDWYQCKVNHITVKASHCKNCGAETRRASEQVRFTPKEI